MIKSKAATAELFSEISNRKKISNKQFHHCEATNFLEEVAKSINFQILDRYQKSIKSPGNHSLTSKFYKHLSNELTPIL